MVRFIPSQSNCLFFVPCLSPDVFHTQVETELKSICNDILDVLDKHLIPAANSGESKVFYYKMYVVILLYWCYLARWYGDYDFEKKKKGIFLKTKNVFLEKKDTSEFVKVSWVLRDFESIQPKNPAASIYASLRKHPFENTSAHCLTAAKGRVRGRVRAEFLAKYNQTHLLVLLNSIILYQIKCTRITDLIIYTSNN